MKDRKKFLALVSIPVALSLAGDRAIPTIDYSTESSCDYWAPCPDELLCVFDRTIKNQSNNGPAGFNEGAWVCQDRSPYDTTLIPCPDDKGRLCATSK